MTKRVDLSITIELPNDHGVTKVSVGPNGSVRAYNKEGKEVTPEYVERGVHYQRTKGPKYQTRSLVVGDYASVGGLEELTKLESFIVVDTNSVEIEGTKVSAAYFVRARLVAEGDAFRIISLDHRGHAYEFHDVPENPEMLAILKIAHDILQGRDGLPINSKIGFVTDSEMGSHAAISARQQTIYGKHNLPEGFSLIYASSDTGQELANTLMRFCDNQSTKYLERLRQGSFRRSGLSVLEEDPSVRFRYTYYPDLKIGNPIVKGISIGPETKYGALCQ